MYLYYVVQISNLFVEEQFHHHRTKASEDGRGNRPRSMRTRRHSVGILRKILCFIYLGCYLSYNFVSLSHIIVVDSSVVIGCILVHYWLR